MKKLFVLVALLGMSVMAAEKTIYDFTLNSIDGQPTPLSTFKGKVVLLVNVASRCGFTPQYAGLESIYEKYKDRGFVIVGIPATRLGAYLRLRSDESPAARHKRVRLALLLSLSPAFALYLIGYYVKGLEILQLVGPLLSFIIVLVYVALYIKAMKRSESIDD